MERVLIAYYSFEGHTEKVAEEIASRIRENGGEADLLKIRVKKEPPHAGAGKFLAGGWMALTQKDPGILNEDISLDGYDRIFLGMPVWAGTAPGAIAAFLRKAKPEGKNFYLFAVSGSGEDKKTLSRTTDNLRGNRVVKTISLQDSAPLDVLDAFVAAPVPQEVLDDVLDYINTHYETGALSDYSMNFSMEEAEESEGDADYAAPAYHAAPPSSAPASSGQTAPREASYRQVAGAPSAREAAPMANVLAGAAHASAAQMTFELDEGFSELLFQLIDERGMKDADCYKKANVSKQVFSNIRSNSQYLPSKSTVLALAIALELDLDETKQLLERAGYAISHSSLSDVIVEYFIQNKRYNIFEINQTLFEYDQKILGSR